MGRGRPKIYNKGTTPLIDMSDYASPEEVNEIVWELVKVHVILEDLNETLSWGPLLTPRQLRQAKSPLPDIQEHLDEVLQYFKDQGEDDAPDSS